MRAATGADITSPDSFAAVATGADAIVSAVSARGVDYTLADVARSLTEGARQAGVRRVVIVGGAGSLEVAPGARLVDAPAFPAEYTPEALQHADALEVYRAVDDLDWTYVSPAAFIHPASAPAGREARALQPAATPAKFSHPRRARPYSYGCRDHFGQGGSDRC